MNRSKKLILLSLIFLVHFILSYNPQMLFKTRYFHWGWNLCLLASVFIILLMKLRNPDDWKQWLGIDFKMKDWFGFFVSTLLILVFSYYFVGYVTSLSEFAFKPQLFYYKEYFSQDFAFAAVLSNYVYFIPETFNEEMLIGAMFLFGLEKGLKKLSKTMIALIVALFFCLMHQALYKFSPVQPGILLTFITLSTLFFVGVLRNVLILKTRKIAYSWAIHLSFNLVFFAGLYVHESTNTFASEPERFNIVFGNWPMFSVTAMLAIASVVWLNFGKTGEQID